MQMQGSRELIVSQQIAWDALNDPEVLKACIPGCDRVELSGDNQYNIGMALKIGPVSAKFTGVINLLDVEAPRSYRLKFEGQGGPAGFGKGESKVVLEPTATGCLLTYTVEAQVGGKVAQLGQRLIDGAASKMADDFFKRFDAHMVTHHGEAISSAAGAAEGAEGAEGADAETAPPASGKDTPSNGASLKWLARLAVLGLVVWYVISQQ